ncbi:LexA family transcriptional regulator [Asticcacaulis taihuensis]|uniref:LexA family transcriptional regulator n=1 Tax=Asticcacaulis taihuensis TaxID=260084 RepID=UPI0026F28AF1|nr:XRE family transcriptional regulator [Asticcacaulis taihuensis]
MENISSQAQLYGKALQRLRKRAGLTQDEAAKLINVGQSAWGRYEKGGNDAFLDIRVQQRAVEALGFNMDDFNNELEGAALGRPMFDNTPRPAPEEPKGPGILPLDGAVRAGPQGFAVYDDGRPETYDLARVIDKNTRVLRVAGDSMVPILEPGSFVTYDKTGIPRRNQLCVVRLKDGQYFVKKFVRATSVKIECIEMEQFSTEDGRIAYVEKTITYNPQDVEGIYPAGVRME